MKTFSNNSSKAATTPILDFADASTNNIECFSAKLIPSVWEMDRG